MALWTDLRRLRYRDSLREAKLVKPGEIVKCDFNPGLFVSRKMMKGSRLRPVVTAMNSIFWQKNYCSGGAWRRRPRKMPTLVTFRSTTTRSMPARFNCRCADEISIASRVHGGNCSAADACSVFPLFPLPLTRESFGQIRTLKLRNSSRKQQSGNFTSSQITTVNQYLRQNCAITRSR